MGQHIACLPSELIENDRSGRLLAEKANIPMVRAQMPLIEDLQTEAFWQDVNPAILERVRKDLRTLVKLIEKTARKPVFTFFADELGPATEIELDVFTPGLDFQRFQAKARSFLRQLHENQAVRKLRTLQPLTPADLHEIELLLVSEGVGTERDLAHARQLNQSLGLFLRSLSGLDRATAKDAFNSFLNGRTPTANQIEFLNMVVDHITDCGLRLAVHRLQRQRRRRTLPARPTGRPLRRPPNRKGLCHRFFNMRGAPFGKPITTDENNPQPNNPNHLTPIPKTQKFVSAN